ncbi:unnamed protein product [Discosporangium mesarthrocarpum]
MADDGVKNPGGKEGFDVKLKGKRSKRGRMGQKEDLPVVSDERFKSMHMAPAFRRVKPDDRKVQLDDRFSAVLSDPRFHVPTGIEPPPANVACF